MGVKDGSSPADRKEPEVRAAVLRPTHLVNVPEELAEGLDADSGADASAVISWLETGEGDPWPKDS